MKMKSCFLVGWILANCYAFGGEELPLAMPQASKDSPARAATEAYRNGWVSRAVELATPLTVQGNADAFYVLGLAQEEPAPARRSRKQALDYFYRHAAEAGHPEGGMRRWLHMMSSEVEAESQDGRSKLEAAANEGDPRAMRVMGEAEARGFTQEQGKPDFDKAREWWEKAAAAGDHQALLLLARMSEGVFINSPVDDRAAALDYYRQAVATGMEEAIVPAARLLMASDEPGAREMLVRAIAKGIPSAHLVLGDFERDRGNDALALESYRQGAAAGDTTCMRKLAEPLLGSGKRGEGMEWLRKAVEAGDPDAAAELGKQLVNEDPRLAATYLLLAAEEGNHQAQHDLAMLYLEGKLGRQDPRAAVTWLTLAMSSTDAGMQYKLATLHERGLGCPINYANAGILYTLACNKGHAAAAGRIAFLASEGLGTRLDPVKAHAYASIAIERGDEDSKVLLEKLGATLTSAQKEEASKVLNDLKGNPDATATPQKADEHQAGAESSGK